MKKTGLFIFGAGMGTGLFANYRLIRNKVLEQKEQLEKYERQFLLLKRWVMQSEGSDQLQIYLEENGFKKVAVYGMEHLGMCVAHKLTGASCKLEALYGIDVDRVSSEIEIYRPEDTMPETDVVIVTAIFAYETLKNELKKKFSCQVVSLEEII